MKLQNEVMLTACILTYNHKKYIRQCLDSILGQKTNFTFEVLVADDVSSDETVSIVKEEYGDRVTVLERTANVGVSRNLYDCMKAAKGRYLYVLAGDDWISCMELFQRHVDFLEIHPEYSSVANWTDIMTDDGEKIDIIQNTQDVFTLYDFLKAKHINSQVGVVRNYWKCEEDNSYLYKCCRNNEETPLNFYILEKGPKAIIQESLVCYRYVCKEDGENYNSIHKLSQVFADIYGSIDYLSTIKGNIYNFEFMKLRNIYEFFGAALKRDHSIKELIEVYCELSKADRKMLFHNLMKLIKYRGRFPDEYMEERIIKG